MSGLGTRGAARCAVSSNRIATHVATGAARFGTYAWGFRHVDGQPWSRPGQAIAVELRGSLGAPKDPGASLRLVSWGAAPGPPPGLCLGSWSRRGRGARLPSSGLSAFAPPPGGPGRGGWGSRAPGSPFPPGHSRHRSTGANRGRAASPRCIHLPGWGRPGCGGSPAPSGGSQEGSGLTSRLCGQVRSGSHPAVHPGRGGDLGRTWNSDAETATHSR